MILDHSWIQARLDEYVDGGLAEEERAAVERHLEGCAACTAEVESILALQARARTLPREIAPARDLWPEIRARIEAGQAGQAPAGERRAGAEDGVIDLAARRGGALRWNGALARAAAVVALVALSSGITAYLVRAPGGAAPVALGPVSATPPAALPQPAPARGSAETAADAAPAPPPARLASAAPRPQHGLAAFREGTGGFDGAVEGLRAAFESQRGELSPETVAIIEQNLAIIDRAIAESRAALEKDPNNPELPLLLSDIYRQKVQLLQDAVQLQARS